MASPFPGMDPYLEDSGIWPGFHHRLADELADRLNTHIGPKYYADVEVHTVFEEITIAAPSRARYPDVGVYARAPEEPAPGPAATAVAVSEAPVKREIVAGQTKLRAVHVYLTETDELVTSIELLSPYNKRSGDGLEEYRRKRSEHLLSSVHLVEIDLLRGGTRPGREVNEPPLDTDYVMLVNRYWRGRNIRISEIWPAALNEALPGLPVPLLPPDPDVAVSLNAAIEAIYGRAGYDWRIDYQHPVPPPELRPKMATWLQEELPDVTTTAG
ncbi:MAG: hypothetical protein MAG451_01883 [Anaerolineales bacterium]|nr:hypothetical protein [Anaerolineales bacterium]